MSYEIAEVAESYHRSYQGRNGTTYVFKVTTTEGAVAEVGKLKGTPQVGDVYNVLREPSANAPEGALPTLSEKDTESSPPPQNGNGGHTFAGSGDDKQSSITRQGAEQRAALYLIAKAMVKQHLGEDLTRDDFKKLVEWFVEDARA